MYPIICQKIEDITVPSKHIVFQFVLTFTRRTRSSLMPHALGRAAKAIDVFASAVER